MIFTLSWKNCVSTFLSWKDPQHGHVKPQMQAKKELDEFLQTNLANKIIESTVPSICTKESCILGIDEAGRGPVLGPMVYAIAYYPRSEEAVLSTLKFADSKELTEASREKLFESLQTSENGFRDLGYISKVISPNMISNSMLRRKKYNLNALSHDTAIDLIKRVELKGIKIGHIYIDTVGPAAKYKEKLEKFFPNYVFTVAEKADSKYPIVSAASVCAKVKRDRIVKNWVYLEGKSLLLDTFNLGSGYPADPETKQFLSDCIDPVFGFPTLARFSWSTITKALEKGACKCDFNEPKDDGEDPNQLTKRQNNFKKFFQKKPVQSPARTSNTVRKNRTNADVFLESLSISRVVSLT